MALLTISGLPGTGTTTISLLLQEKLGYSYVYSGNLFRTLAEEHNMSLSEFGTYCETHPEIDRELDSKQLSLLDSDNLILEGRMSGWLAHTHHKDAFKILLIADLDTRVARIVKRESGDIKARRQEILQREQSEKKRYQTYYHADPNNASYYDLVIDTSTKTPEEIVALILKTLDFSH